MNSGVILITGTGRGLGKALAESFLRDGFTVFGCSRGPSTIFEDRYTHSEMDVADETAVASLFREISSRKLALDLVVNNAGATQNSLAIMTKSENAESIIRTNLLGNFLISRDALRIMMRQRRGRIVNFSSINVPLGSVGSCLYNACKAGIDSLARTLANECPGNDITINTLGLSLVAGTGMVDGLSQKALDDKQKRLVKPALLGVDEIRHAIDFLRSPLARNISGQTIYFGGL